MNLLQAILFCTTILPAEDVTSEHPGAVIYRNQCVDCHGLNGGGEDGYPALFGDRPAVELAEVIATTMPEGEPEACEGDDAQAVAEWMLTAFYSPEAQARINPPRKRLSRLTVSQHRNAFADLISGFMWTVEPDDKPGLKATYYKSRRCDKKNEAFERVDPVVNFNFGEGTPDKDKIEDANSFGIRWNGSILVDETGWYEFFVDTENGFELFVNDSENALIDANVRSGDGTQYSASIYLLSGRLYSLNMKWFTFQEKTASIKLSWKPPHGEKQLIPADRFRSQYAPKIMIVSTPIPPDDRSDGYIRGTSVSPEWYEASLMAAVNFADQLPAFYRSVADLKRKDTGEQRREKLKTFCETLAYRAFRRPLSEEQKHAYVRQHFVEGISTEDAIRRSVIAILKSPRFLYREVVPTDDLFTQVDRLAFALVDSIPNPSLLEAASEGWVHSDQAFRQQAERLMKTYRSRTRLKEFLRVWLALERLHGSEKSEELFPDFSQQLLADLRTSLEYTLDEAVAHQEGFRRLMESKQVYMNSRIADFYGQKVDSQHSADFRPTEFEPDQRSGVVTHPFLLTSLAYDRTSSPIHRGVFLSRGILGRSLKPPSDSVSPAAPDLEPHLTTRQRVGKQTSPAMCASCHTMINGLGFTLENFDAVGRFRSSEKNQSVDATGRYRQRLGDVVDFNGPTQMVDFLTNSHETHRSVVRQLFHFMVQQPILAYGSDSIHQFAETFSESDLNLKSLALQIAVSSARHSSSSETEKTSP